MRENRNYKKLIASCATVLCMAVVMILTVFYTDASDESTAIKYQEDYTWKSETYKDDKGAGIAPEAPEGYLFAGWYTKDGTAYKAVSNPMEGAVYCAKFVPEEVLGIKAQISKTLTDDNDENDGTTAAIRFVTSIDNSRAYQHVGFNIKKGSSGTAEDANTTKYVYRTIYAVGASDSNGKAEDYVPEELFHEASYYFKTWTIGNIVEAAYNTEITVIPYWITLDGTRVEGTKATKVATVNLGRSWIYINETANADGNQYGTKKHPYNDFAMALDNIVLDKNGKVLLQSDYTAATDFDWKSHGIDVTVTGVNGTETLDFSAKDAGTIRDAVTFTHMSLKLFKNHTYAAGNRFKIADDVKADDNAEVVIYGGANGSSVKNTNVTVLAGTYEGIYGGGVGANGTVTENTRVIVGSCNIFNKTSTHTRRIHGGGKRATVQGNTYVEIGADFNADLGSDYTNSSMYSTVYGGGFGESSGSATVQGNTYVVVKGNARINYVFGAGGPLSTVDGTSRVVFESGYAKSVYGGANSTGTNSHTSVKMTGGKVEQIFGGNEAGTAGNADVQVLGGTVTRRIYGGCYNEYDSGWLSSKSVDGYSSVTIGTDAIISDRYDRQGDTSICATSRLQANATDAGEIGVMVLNPGVSSSAVGSTMSSYTAANYLYTNFLVNVGEGGSVVVEQGALHISASDIKPYATVKYGDEVLGIVKGEGKCPLPALKATNSVQEIGVIFDTAEPDTTNFEARNVTGTDVVYYPTFEEAMDMAEDETNVVVLKDIEISETYTIADKLTISSEKEVTLTRASGVTGNLFEVTGELHISGDKNGNLILDGTYDDSVKDVVRAVNVASGATLDMDYATIQNFYTTGDGAAVYVHESSEATLTECIFQGNQSNAAGGAIFIAKASSTDIAGKVTSENSSFAGNIATGNGGAVHCKGTYIDKNCNYTNNTGKNGGALVVFDGGSASLTGNNESALFSNNKASGDSNSRGAAIFVNGSKSSIEVSGYVFDKHSVGKGIIHVISNGSASLTDVVFQDTNEVRTINVLGTLTFDNITGATLVQNSAGKIYVAGYEETNALSVTPYTNTDTYTVGHEVLVRAEGVEELVFEAACAGITVTPDGSDNDWWIKSDGTLVWGEACIDTTCYATLKDAVDAINEDDSIGETDNITIEVLRNTPISSTVQVGKNITIVNTPNSSMTISRASGMTVLMFSVSSGASLTLGSNETTESGELTVNGYTTSTIGTRIVENSGTFTLSRNAILTGANTNATPWGCALINKGTAHLRGSITDNTCAGACGAVLQHTGTLYIYEGTYTGNSATRSVDHSSGPSMGGFLRVYGGTAYIYGGDFADNSTTGNGGAIYVDKEKTAYITGGTFLDNTAGQEGNDVYAAGTLNYTSSNVTASTDGIKGNGTINSDYSGQ